MGRSLLFIILAAVLGGSYLTLSTFQAETETGSRRADAQATVLARQLAESGQAIALASITQDDGFRDAGGLFVSDRPYEGGEIAFEAFPSVTVLGNGTQRADITVSGLFGGATHRLRSVYEFDPMDFPGPFWLDVPYASGAIGSNAVIDNAGMPDYFPQIDPRKYDDLRMGELGMSFDGIRQQMRNTGAQTPSWNTSGGTRTHDLGDGVTTADDLYFAVSGRASAADGDLIISRDVTISDTRTVGAPNAITVIQGDARVRSGGSVTGYGALVIEGDLRVEGALDWTGLVIVRSVEDDLVVDLGNATSITGALVVSQEAFPPGGHLDVTTFRAPTGSWPAPWGIRAAGPGSLEPSSWPLDQDYLWYDHTHRFDQPEPADPNYARRRDGVVEFANAPSNRQEPLTGLAELLDHLGGEDVQVEFVNPQAHGHAVYVLEVDGERVTGAVRDGFTGTDLEGSQRHRSTTFDARDLDVLTIRPRSLRSLRRLWDGEGSCPGDEWPYCVGERRDRSRALTIRIRRARDGASLYEGALYWHMQQGDEQDQYQADIEAWRTGVQNGSIPFGTTVTMQDGSNVTYGLVPIVALADRLRFDGNEVHHVSTTSQTVGVDQAGAVTDPDEVVVCHGRGTPDEQTLTFAAGSGYLNSHLGHGDPTEPC